MVLKRQLSKEGEAGSDRIKHPHLVSSLFKGLNHGRTLQESVPCLEPIIRKWVREAVDGGVDKFLRSSYKQVDCSGSRSLQLLFHGSLPETLFTGSRIVSEDTSPMKIVVWDSKSRQIISSGPLSSLKVAIVVLNGDFGPDDREDWTTNEFDTGIVMNREGKRPLMTGELIVSLQGGVGYIRDLSFTDNSRWMRNGKFRLGAKVHTSTNAISIREAMSNAFKVKDHRGEPYRKHHPPSLDDEVWRLEKIAKDGPTHEKLNNFRVFTVRDLLLLYATDQLKLRTQILHKHSDKNWGTIIKHAKTCPSDDKRYIYRAAQGTGLIFNSIYDVVGVTFDYQSYHSVESLPPYQKRMVEDLKQHAYKNLAEWLPVHEPGYPMLVATPSTSSFTNPNLCLHDINLQELDQRAEEINSVHQTSQPYETDEEPDNFIFELGESSHSVQAFNPTLMNCTGTSNSPRGFNAGGYNPWASGENYESSQLSIDDLPLDDNFQVI